LLRRRAGWCVLALVTRAWVCCQCSAAAGAPAGRAPSRPRRR
jgi:hypothetical protein